MSSKTFNIVSDLSDGIPQNFSIKLSPPIILDGEGEYTASIVKLSMWNSSNNISAELNNNKLTYIKPDLEEVEITLPDGAYDVPNFNYVVQRKMHDNGDYIEGGAGKEDEYYVSFLGNDATELIRFEISGGYKFDFSEGDLYKYLGCLNDKIYSAPQFFENRAQVNNIDSVLVHCNLIRGNSYLNGDKSDILLAFPLTEPPSYQMIIEPMIPDEISISERNEISEIQFYITDQNNKILELNGENVNITLKLKRLK